MELKKVDNQLWGAKRALIKLEKSASKDASKIIATKKMIADLTKRSKVHKNKIIKINKQIATNKSVINDIAKTVVRPTLSKRLLSRLKDTRNAILNLRKL